MLSSPIRKSSSLPATISRSPLKLVCYRQPLNFHSDYLFSTNLPALFPNDPVPLCRFCVWRVEPNVDTWINRGLPAGAGGIKFKLLFLKYYNKRVTTTCLFCILFSQVSTMLYAQDRSMIVLGFESKAMLIYKLQLNGCDTLASVYQSDGEDLISAFHDENNGRHLNPETCDSPTYGDSISKSLSFEDSSIGTLDVEPRLLIRIDFPFLLICSPIAFTLYESPYLYIADTEGVVFAYNLV